MIELTWSESSHEFESLAVSLRAILKRGGVTASYEDLLAALGLGSAIIANTDDTFGWWSAYARDTALDATAALYGLRLRDLHPPEASAGLRHSIEFPQHFHDSYEPLIRAALAHGLPVLVWRGWPPPRDHMWGVITDARGGMLVGHSLWHDGRPLPMTGPAHQAYVVEACRPPDVAPSREALFFIAARHLHAQWNDRWTAHPTILTGNAAWRALEEGIETPSEAFDRALPMPRQIMQTARTLSSARRTFAAWLREVGPRLDPQPVQLAARWSRTCDRVANLLSSFQSDESVRTILAAADGVEQVRATIRGCADLEAALVAQLDERSDYK